MSVSKYLWHQSISFPMVSLVDSISVSSLLSLTGFGAASRWTYVQQLTLQKCPLGKNGPGATILCVALPHWPLLNALHLGQCNIQPDVFASLAKTVAVIPQLRSLSFPYNRIGDQGLVLAVSDLQRCSRLAHHEAARQPSTTCCSLSLGCSKYM